MGGRRGAYTPSPAKISRPTYQNVLPRKRLFKQLDQSRKKPVLWVSGPAGSGKTTLISSYIDDRDLPCLWYQMDEGDADLATFFYYMGLAGKKAAPRRKKPLPSLSPEYMMGLPTFTKRFFEDLTARLPIPSVIVLDNYQEVSSTSDLHESLLHGFSAIPEGITVIVLSRLPTPSVFTRLLANAMMNAVEWDDLQFRENESRSLMKLHGAKISAKVSQEIHERTAGWAAGIVLLMHSGGKSMTTDEHWPGTFGEDIFDYFAGEVFRKTDEEARLFLMKTSFLPHMTIDMTETVTGTYYGRRKLSDLSRRNLFVMKKSGSVATYQYHPLFRHFLQDRAERELNEDQVKEIRRRSAEVLVEKGHMEEGAQLFIETGQWEELAGLVMSDAQSLLSQGRFSVLDEWLRALPRNMIENDYWLRFFSGAAMFPRDPSASKAFFEQAFHGFLESGDAVGAFLSWSSVIEAIAFRAEELGELDIWIPRHEELVKRFGEVVPEPLKDRVAAAMYTALEMRMPDHPDFSQWETRALNVIVRSKDIHLRAKLFFYHILYLQDRGYFSEAEDALTEFRIITKHEAITPLASLFYRLAEIHQANFTGNHDKCIACVEEGIAYVQESGVHVLDALMAGQAVWSCLKVNDLASARHYLSLMENTPSFTQPFNKGFYLFLKSFENLESGELQIAREYSEKTIALSKKTGYVGTDFLSLLIGAHISFESGDPEKTQVLLDQSGDHFRRFGNKSKSYKFDLLLTMAYFAFREGRSNTACDHLREALELGNARGYFQSSIWRPRVITYLCIKALEAGIEPDYVRSLIQKRNLVPKSIPVHIEAWPWPLKVYTLGRFGILRDDKPVKTEGRAQKKPIEMLKVIIALGGRKILEESITDILWPEAAGDDAHNTFTTTLSRLRKILGLDGAIALSEGKITLMQNICWVDVWAFERLIGDADRAWKHSENESARMLSERALIMYSGPFLSGESDHWPVSLREKLKSKFLRNVLNLGSHLEENTMWDKALEHYTRGLEVDELIEEFYKHAMTCCMKLDRKAEALSIYNRCSETLERILGISPSKETSELGKQLRS
jgi:LuxR family maltose regulon positive regulatory protein